MPSIEICPRCGGEVWVHISLLNGVTANTGSCSNCGRLVAYRLTPEPVEEGLTQAHSGHKARGWVLDIFDEGRGCWRTRTYAPDDEALMRRHVIELSEQGTPYRLKEAA